MKKVLFLISTMLVIAACTSEDLFIDESNTTESILTRAALSNEYLDIKTTIFDEMDEEDWSNVNKALMRLSVTHDSKNLTYLQEYHDSLNLSRKLYDYIKKGIEHGNKLLQESDTVKNEIKSNISRVKTRASENGGSSNTGHVCTKQDCVGHSIAYYLNLDIENVNNTIHANLASYPNQPVPCWILEATLGLFGNFTKQTQYHPANAKFPYPVPGIILIPNHALNGLSITKNENSYILSCYDDQIKSSTFLYPTSNQCASNPCDVSEGNYGYYK